FVALLFSWFGAPRALRSFPTRRSSDLSHRSSAGHCALGGVREPSGVARAQSIEHRQIRPLVGVGLQSPGIEEDSQTVLPSAALEDRKSTRLNSSHVSISYAVFCLKKKN